MRDEISGLDLVALERELKVLEGGRIDKIYQKGRDLIIHFYVPGDKKYRFFLSSGRAFLTAYKRDMPEKPPNFCMFLRKHLSGRNVTKVRQKGFDRILEIHTEKYKLVCEVFGDGNFILVNKEDQEILAALETREWKDRSIYRGEEYKYPEPGLDIQDLDLERFSRIRNTEREVVRVLASEIGLGGTYAEEALYRSAIVKDKSSQKLRDEEIKDLFQEMKGIVSELQEGDLNPCIYYRDKKPVAVAPIELEKYEELEKKEFESFSTALDNYFTEREKARYREEREKKFKEKMDKLKRMKEEQERKLEGLKEAVDDNKEKADLIYRNYSLIEDLIETLKKAQKKFDDEELKERLEKEKERGVPEAEAIENLNLHEQQVVVDIGKNVVIDFDIGVEKNAEKYYEKSKSSRKKIEGAKDSLEDTKRKIENLKENKEDIDVSQKFKNKEEAKKKKKWYDKFRWFYSSDGYLVIGGRGATTNDMVIKKYAENNDMVFHADTRGAPFVVIKTEGEEPENVPESTIKEAAQAAASYSSAWKKGLGNIDVYWIKPDQTVKVPGLPKGSFQIQGDRNYRRSTEISASIGTYERGGTLVPMGGPTSAVNSKCDHYIILKKGRRKKSEVAKNIARYFKEKTSQSFDVDQILRALPPDECEIKEKH